MPVWDWGRKRGVGQGGWMEGDNRSGENSVWDSCIEGWRKDVMRFIFYFLSNSSEYFRPVLSEHFFFHRIDFYPSKMKKRFGYLYKEFVKDKWTWAATPAPSHPKGQGVCKKQE